MPSNTDWNSSTRRAGAILPLIVSVLKSAILVLSLYLLEVFRATPKTFKLVVI